MLKISQLQTSATESCEMRGHKLNAFVYLTPGATLAVCISCHREVICNSRPMPNEAPISGAAVAVGCDGD